MRDVTDNVTGELVGLEQKRGRGRPRKAHAMSNAERQAAFRARRKVQQLPIGSVTVTEKSFDAHGYAVVRKPVEVDAYDDCRLEVEQLRAELAEAREVAKRYSRNHGQLLQAWHKLDREHQALKAEKSVTPSNDKSVTTQQWLALLGVACKSKTAKQQLAVGDSQAYRVVMSVLQGRDFERLQDVVYGPDSSVAGARKA